MVTFELTEAQARLLLASLSATTRSGGGSTANSLFMNLISQHPELVEDQGAFLKLTLHRQIIAHQEWVAGVESLEGLK